MKVGEDLNMSKHGCKVLGPDRGIAMLTVMLLLLMLTALGVAAITVTGLENRMAGFAMTNETATTAAESCLSTAVNVIQQTMDNGGVPGSLLNPTNPTGGTAGPVPGSNQAKLTQEILGQADNDPDVADGTAVAVPNVDMTPSVGSYKVWGDIDRLYAKPKSGGSLQFAAGAEGKGSVAEIDIYYRVACLAKNQATGTASSVNAIYACSVSGDSCQKRPY